MYLVSLIRILIIVTIGNISSGRIRLSGIRDGAHDLIEVERGVSFPVEVFGKNLPHHGYYFTSFSRCEDWNRTDVLGKTYFINSPVRSHGRYAFFTFYDGLDFDRVYGNSYILCVMNGAKYINKNLRVYEKQYFTRDLWRKSFICIYCVLMAAYCSGMTLGYMKFSIAELNRMLDYEEPVKSRARRILRFRRRSNWLVCTFAMFSTLHSVIFTTQVESMLTGVKGERFLQIIVPTLVLFIFAEFLPQALCNSKFGFIIASGLWPITVVIFCICAPIAWPASKIIDAILGRDVREVMTEDEKMNIIRNMAKGANRTERKILERATVFSSKSVQDVMTPIDKVFSLPTSQRLNKTTILTLVEKGFTRIPIRDERDHENIYGVLNIKDLISIDLSKSPTVARILKSARSKVPKMRYVLADMQVQRLMQQMRTSGFHIATVTQFHHTGYKVVGIITFEDILEQIFGEIENDSDRNSKNRHSVSNDNYVINWCREAGTEPKYPLSFSQQLLVIQRVLEECPFLQRLGFDVQLVKCLLSTSRIRKSRLNDMLPITNTMVIVWDGEVEVSRLNDALSENVTVRRINDNSEEKIEGVPVFIAGKQIIFKVFQELQIKNISNNGIEPIVEVAVRSQTCSYFKIRTRDIIDLVKQSEKVLLAVNSNPIQSASCEIDAERKKIDTDQDAPVPLSTTNVPSKVTCNAWSPLKMIESSKSVSIKSPMVSIDETSGLPKKPKSNSDSQDVSPDTSKEKQADKPILLKSDSVMSLSGIPQVHKDNSFESI